MYSNIRSDFLCTYNMISDENDSTDLYRIQLLQIFDLKSFDETYISSNIRNLYLQLKNNDEIKEIIKIIFEKNNSNMLFYINSPDNLDKNTLVFQLLFGYDYLYLFHKCYSNYFNDIQNKTYNVNNIYFNELITLINN